jgi:serine/threonine-protein kinase
MRDPKTAHSSSGSTLVPLFPRSWRQIDRYELIAEIARGGMGTVYLCRQTGQAGFQRLYALKLMHQHLAEDADFVGMFLDEARIAASIHHHNVVGILDLGACERGHFVVMEYIEGCTLGQLLRRSRDRRPPQLVAPIILGLLDGLHAAHTHRGDDGELMQLVHRDVSPANVLIGVDGVARITDFGIAKARSRITSTQPGVFKGKLAYTAPELLDQLQPIDARADVWAAGAVLWRTLTGRNLFLGDSDAATIHNILHRDIPLPSGVGLRPPDVFDEVCLRALARNPAERYQSADEMARALREACGRHGLLGAPSDVASWIRTTFRDDLQALRAAIRLATERPDGDRSLPELPAIKASGTGSHSAWTPSSMLAIDTGESASELDELEIEFIEEPAPGSRRRRSLWIPALLGLAIAGGIALAFALRGNADQAEPPLAPPAAAAPAPPAAPPTPTAAPIATPAEAATARPEPEPAPAPPAAAPEPRQRDRSKADDDASSHSDRRARSPRRAKSADRPRGSKRRRAEPAARQQPTPAPQPAEPEIERNPYLRQ